MRVVKAAIYMFLVSLSNLRFIKAGIYLFLVLAILLTSIIIVALECARDAADDLRLTIYLSDK